MDKIQVEKHRRGAAVAASDRSRKPEMVAADVVSEEVDGPAVGPEKPAAGPAKRAAGERRERGPEDVARG